MSVRITDLPEATELNGSELMPIVQNGVTRRTTLDFVNQAAPAALILQQTQQVYQDTIDVMAAHLANPDPHPQYVPTTRSLTAGDGLTGGAGSRAGAGGVMSVTRWMNGAPRIWASV